MSDPISTWVRDQVESAYTVAREHLVAHPDHPGVNVDVVVTGDDVEQHTITTLSFTREDVGL